MCLEGIGFGVVAMGWSGLGKGALRTASVEGEVGNINKLSTGMVVELNMTCGGSIDIFSGHRQNTASMAKVTGHQPVTPCWPILRNKRTEAQG